MLVERFYCCACFGYIDEWCLGNESESFRRELCVYFGQVLCGIRGLFRGGPKVGVKFVDHIICGGLC